jgi:hypothetical protein
MPVMSKTTRDQYECELRARFERLLSAIRGRELESAREGTGSSRIWPHPEQKCATVASAMEIRLLIGDFQGILEELKKLK